MTRLVTRLLLLIGASIVPALAAAQGPPTMPSPGPEHAVLKEDVGTWDASIEMLMPGAPPTPSKGVETNVMGCNGLCLVTDFRGQIMGGPFEGHGVTTWDPSKKKYVGSWSDSMSAGLATTEGAWDAAKRTLTSTMLTPDGSGGTVKMRSTVEYSAGKRVFTMYMPGPDGKEAPSMRITYTRQQK